MSLSSKFWHVCVPTRLLLAVVVYALPDRWLPVAGIVALFGAAGLLYRFATYTESQVGAFKQRVTWNNVRPFHALMWIIFAVLALSQNKRAKWIPVIDIAMGCLFRVVYFT